MKHSNQMRRIKNLYGKVRPYVEKHFGSGSLTEKKFVEFCKQGDALIRTATTKRKMTDPLVEKIHQLERRVRRLETRK